MFKETDKKGLKATPRYQPKVTVNLYYKGVLVLLICLHYQVENMLEFHLHLL